MAARFSGRRPTASELRRIVSSIGERVDAAALDPRHWDNVAEALQGVLPGLRVGIEARDASLPLPLAVAVRGWSARETQDYISHYSAISPWPAAWNRLKALEPELSDHAVPLNELKKTEFYNDWLRPIRDAEHGTGVKLLDSDGRLAVVHVHFGSHRMEEQNAIVSSVLRRLGTRMRGALLANRALASGMPQRAEGTLMDTLLDPAFLLDEKCRLLAANAPGEALISEERVLKVGAQDAFRLVADAAQAQLAKNVQHLCRWGTSQAGQDIQLVAGDKRWTLSLLPVAYNTRTGTLPVSVELFVPRALALAVLRPAEAGGTGIEPAIALPVQLSPAERRFIEALFAGGSVPEIAERLGIAYETARSRLKSIYAKTGVHSQRELMALLLRTTRQD